MFLPIDQSLQERGRERVEWIRSRINSWQGSAPPSEKESPSRDARSACHSILNPKPSSSSRRWQPAGRESLVPAMMVRRRTKWLRCCGLRAWRYSAPRRYSRRALAQRRRCPWARPDILLEIVTHLNAAAVRLGLETVIRGATEETTSGGDRLRRDYRGKVPSVGLPYGRLHRRGSASVRNSDAAGPATDLLISNPGGVRANSRADPAVLASAHEQSVPIFQQLARSHPSGRDDLRAIPAVAAQRQGSVGGARDRHQPRDRPVLLEPVWPDVRRRYS